MRRPSENVRLFSDRRAKIAERMAGATLVVASNPEYIRNHDVEYPYRQDSNLYYLTGFEEPESIFVFRPGRSPETVLFVRKKNPEMETWTGFRYGPELAMKEYKVDVAYAIEDFDSKIVELLKGSEALYYRMYKNPEMDEKIEQALKALSKSQGRTGFGLLSVHDADEFLGQFRVLKSDLDLINQRQACQISAQAHTEVMKYIKPGMNEREIHGYFIHQIYKRGCGREGYNSIVAGGPSACTLHYVFNDQKLHAEDLVLIDAGGEYNYFTGDITRTYPVGGKFSEAQAEVYSGVLEVQKKLIEMVKPGLPFAHLHEAGAHLLTDVMLRLGLLSGRREDLVAANRHRKYYPHGIGHYLGMDVHDAGLYYSKAKEPKVLEPGMVFTIEPGIYIPYDDQEAAEKYRGIGIRIEDNILVTKNGFENLTIDCPKEIKDLEALIGQS